MVVGSVAVNNNENFADLPSCSKVVVRVTGACQISINGNTEYQNYNDAEREELFEQSGINRIYVQSTGISTVRYWAYD